MSAPVKTRSADYRRGYKAGYSKGRRLAYVTNPNEHAKLLAKQLKWSTTSKRMRAAIEAAIKCLTNLEPRA